MKTIPTIRIYLPVVLCLCSTSLVCQSTNTKEDGKEHNRKTIDTLVKQVQSANAVYSKDLEHPLVNIGKEAGDRQKLVDLRLMLDEAVAPSLSSGNSTPLRVRGGAMTFRHSTDWGMDNSVGQPCVQVDTSKGAKVELNMDPGTAAPNAPTMLSTGWTIDLFGRLKDFTDDTNNGIHLEATANCTVGTGAVATTKNGIVFKPIGSATFYPTSLDKDGVGHSMRYKMTCPDEDACEHLSIIKIVPTTGANPSSPHCDNGECLVRIIPS